MTFKKTAEYFSIQNSASTVNGKIDDLFRKWADVKGSDCEECQQLGLLFTRAIDAAKSGEKVVIPKSFEDYKKINVF